MEPCAEFGVSFVVAPLLDYGIIRLRPLGCEP